MKTKVTELGQKNGPIAGQNRKQGEVIHLPEDEAHSLHVAGLVDIQKPSRLDQLKQADQEAIEVAKTLKPTEAKTGDAIDAADPVVDDTNKVSVKKKN